MNRLSLPSSPLLLGFEELERLIDRSMKSSGDGYPPYNIERVAPDSDGSADVLRITLAVAGFARDQLDIQLEDKQLTVRGKQPDYSARVFIHRGIAARQFSRSFVLADGLEVRSADLSNGLLSIDLVRLTPARKITTIAIADKNSQT
jgi:HSP20 family molecular chaperone IbpA